jgi:hypothetical protein
MDYYRDKKQKKGYFFRTRFLQSGVIKFEIGLVFEGLTILFFSNQYKIMHL